MTRFKQAAHQVGSVQIQNTGTIVGNVCNASPAADGVPTLLALDASVEVASAARGVQNLPLSDFILGVRQTALKPDELITAIVIPHVPDGAGSQFEKLGSRSYLVISIAMVSAMIATDDAQRITHASIAGGGLFCRGTTPASPRGLVYRRAPKRHYRHTRTPCTA